MIADLMFVFGIVEAGSVSSGWRSWAAAAHHIMDLLLQISTSSYPASFPFVTFALVHIDIGVAVGFLGLILGTYCRRQENDRIQSLLPASRSVCLILYS